MLLVGCARAPGEKPQAEPAPATDPAPAGSPAPAAEPGPAPSEPGPAVTAAAASRATARVDFATDVRPILESRCQPCHFAGGRMYERLPFDRPETILKLGPKLFTRIKDEDSQKTIRAFLDQGE